MCSPGENFCEGSKLWACTRSGADAVLAANCTGGTTTNPMGCFSDQCPPGQPSCCRSSKEVCRWNFSSPSSAGGIYEDANGSGPRCGTPSPCAGDTFSVSIYFPSSASTCAEGSSEFAGLSIARPLAFPGQVFDLSQPQATLRYNDGMTGCFSWIGTVTWHSDIPSWRVSVNATCAEPGRSNIRVVGTLNGDT